MDLLDYLKYILPLTILFDACVSGFLIRNSFKSKIIRLYSLALITLVVWEIFFWIGIFKNYGTAGNDVIDRTAFIFGVLSPYLLMQFIFKYANSNFSKYLKRALFSVVATLVVLIGLFGVGNRNYSGEETYNYSLGTAGYSSLILAAYSVVLIAIAVCTFYQLITMVKPELSVLEMARRKLMRNSILLSILVTLLPCTVLPLIVMITSNNLSQVLASDWYITLIVFSTTCASVWTAATAYALTRYRLFDITIKVRRSLLLSGCVVGLSVGVFLLNEFILSRYLDQLQQSLAITIYVIGASVLMIMCARKIGVGDPISLAISEPVQPGIPVQQLLHKLQRYVETEFDMKINSMYVLNVETKQYVQGQTGEVINLSKQTLTLLQTGEVLSQEIPVQLKPAQYIAPLIHNDVLLGFLALSGSASKANYEVVSKTVRPFSELIYQALFAHYQGAL
jgi:hypothetical protein